MLPMEASTRSAESGSGSDQPKAELKSPTRPYLVPYMKPHIRVATTAGTAYGRKIVMRKKLLP